MTDGRILIRGGTVLSMDRAVGNGAGLDVLVEGGVISEIGTGLRARGATTVEAANAIVMPGFVDSHRHAWHSLFRGLGRRPGADPAALASHYEPEHLYAATMLSLLGAAAAGITTVVDWADAAPTAAHVEAALQAHADVGLRSVFVATDAAGALSATAVPELLARVGGAAPDALVAYGDPSLGTPADVASRWDQARRAGLRIHTHGGVVSGGGVARLGSDGLLSDDVTFVHCTNLDAGDLDALAGSGARVSITPVMEMTDGIGLPPMQEFVDRGIRPGLGVGSELEAPNDLFAQMRAANSIQHATLFDLKLAGKGGVPNLLSTRDVIRYGTIDGAASAGLAGSIGSIAPGKQADIIVLRTDRPNISPVNDPIGAVVWGMDTSNLEWVFVAGRSLMAEGVLTGDVPQVRSLAEAAHRHLLTATGIGVGAP